MKFLNKPRAVDITAEDSDDVLVTKGFLESLVGTLGQNLTQTTLTLGNYRIRYDDVSDKLFVEYLEV